MTLITFCTTTLTIYLLVKILSGLKKIQIELGQISKKEKIDYFESKYISLIKAYCEFYTESENLKSKIIKLSEFIQSLSDPIKNEIIGIRVKLREEYSNYSKETYIERRDSAQAYQEKINDIHPIDQYEELFKKHYHTKKHNWFSCLSDKLRNIKIDDQNRSIISEQLSAISENIDKLQIISSIMINILREYFYDLNLYFIDAFSFLVYTTFYFYSEEDKVTFIGKEEIRFLLDLSNFVALNENLHNRKYSLLEIIYNKLIPLSYSQRMFDERMKSNHQKLISNIAFYTKRINECDGIKEVRINDFVEYLKMQLYDGDTYAFTDENTIDFTKLYHSLILKEVKNHLNEDDKRLLELLV